MKIPSLRSHYRSNMQTKTGKKLSTSIIQASFIPNGKSAWVKSGKNNSCSKMWIW